MTGNGERLTCGALGHEPWRRFGSLWYAKNDARQQIIAATVEDGTRYEGEAEPTWIDQPHNCWRCGEVLA